ncbi:MAG: hypothetical protein JNL74_06640 [Fibrobacteres bacterium]|nr:hypothetical protein [Fibrobacterota bacterium]
MFIKTVLISAFLLFQLNMAAVTITSGPTLTKKAVNSWEITFTVSGEADVAISIVNIADSTVVRHLAAGVLGAKAPAPFTKNTFTQTLAWDGTNDRGEPVSVPEANLKARVRAGMTTQLVSLIGGEPYSIGAYSQYISGIVAGSDGSVYVAGAPANFWHEHYGQTFLSVRKFDKSGNYVKTLFPMPSNLSQNEVAGWGVINNPDGSFIPKSTNTSLPMFTRTKLGYMNHRYNSKLHYINAEGKLVFGDLDIMSIGTDGSCTGNGTSKTLFKTPAFATYNPAYSVGGEANLLPLKNGKFLLTGIFNYTGTLGTSTQIVPDTNFYRDGKVFIIDTVTGNASTWLAIDSVPKTNTDRLAKLGGGSLYSALHGTAMDSSNRIYVCDRLNKQVGVYDTNAKFLGALPIVHPHRVQICGRNGSIYVLTQSQAAWAGACLNTVKLIKFSSFSTGATPLCTINVASANIGRSGRSATSSMAVNDVDGEISIWVGVWGQGIRIYKDNGSTLSLTKDMKAISLANNDLGSENPTPDRLQVDTRNDNLYVSDSWYGLYRLTNWNSPRLSNIITKAKKRLYGLDWTISPKNELYVYEGTNFSAPVTRYTLGDSLEPVNFSNTPGKNQLTGPVYARFAPCTGARGIAVANDNNVAIMGVNADRMTSYVGIYPDTGSTITSYGNVKIGTLPQMSGGVKLDRNGNIYVGAGIRSATYSAPTWFSSDTGFKWGNGSIIRFKAGDSGAVTTSAVFNADKVYDLPLAPFSMDRLGGCQCRSPRFDVDAYGRLIVPSAITCQVTVADNDGNVINQFGKYGNIDSRGSLPGLPGQAVISSTDIPMAWPTSAVASEDYIYVSDYMNYRIAKVRMVYSADNLPGLTALSTAVQENMYWRTPLFSIASSPMPFSGVTNINVNLPGSARVKLDVCDVRGRVVRTLGESDLAPGLHRFSWNGKDASDRSVAAGIYIYRLQADKKVLIAKTILSR